MFFSVMQQFKHHLGKVGEDYFAHFQWLLISLDWFKENLQESPIFHGKNHGFLLIFPSTNPLMIIFHGFGQRFNGPWLVTPRW